MLVRLHRGFRGQNLGPLIPILIGSWETAYHITAHWWLRQPREGRASYCSSLLWLFAISWTAALQASLSFTISRSLLKLMSIESIMPSNHLILCCSLLLLPSIFPNIRVLSKELTLRIRWTKYWSISFSINTSNEHSGLISIRVTGLIFLLSKRLSRVFTSTTIQKQQYFSTQPSLWSNSHIHIQLLEKPQLWLDGLLPAMWCLFLIYCLGLS